MNYDANKLPLGIVIVPLPDVFDVDQCTGKLAKSTILSGFTALKV